MPTTPEVTPPASVEGARATAPSRFQRVPSPLRALGVAAIALAVAACSGDETSPSTTNATTSTSGSGGAGGLPDGIGGDFGLGGSLNTVGSGGNAVGNGGAGGQAGAPSEGGGGSGGQATGAGGSGGSAAPCAPGELDCGTCIDPNLDTQNCGSCGNDCTDQNQNPGTPNCANGACVDDCASAGFPDCQSDGDCDDTTKDAKNCGNCDVACDPGEQCVNSDCVTCVPSQACSTGLQGVCSTGICDSQGDNCVQTNSSTVEICDNQDNDCDGQVDEGNPQGGTACLTGQPGACAAGTDTCTNGVLGCVPNNAPTTEVCNGIDDDCDGALDDGNPGSGVACTSSGLGECQPGLTTCIAGANACNPINTPAALDLCDGLDNDCNGAVDDGNYALTDANGNPFPCSTGLPGVCAPGTVACNGVNGFGCNATIQPGQFAEHCDGLDNDCDGQTDEGFPVGQVCSQVVSPSCTINGTFVCDNSSATGTSCSSVPGVPNGEICSNLGDDNCNGAVDETPCQ